jgi:hypothetical protein
MQQQTTAAAVPGPPGLARRVRPSGVWNEQAIAEIAARETAIGHAGIDEATSERIREFLRAASEAAGGGGRFALLKRMASPWHGASVERTWGHIDAAEEALLQASEDWYLAGQLPRILRRVQKSLAADDPRRVHVEELVAKRNGASTIAMDHHLVSLLADCSPEDGACNTGVVEAIRRLHQPRSISREDRASLLAAFHAANTESRRRLARVRSFRMMLYVSACVLTVAMAGLATLGFAKPRILPLCFVPENQIICPTGVAELNAGPATGQEPVEQSSASKARQDQAARNMAHQSDIALIELVGLVAASVAAAAALRNARGTSTPYSVPISLAILKLPTGALTAVLGLLLMRGQFIPGLSALDSPAQILAWAILFGYAQQLFTRFVDQRATSVLESAGPGDRKAPVQAATADA